MSSSPLISIVVPVYNVAAYLPACLDSLVAQTFSDFEVIVVNDGSTDGSAAILASYAQQCPQLRILTQTNQGVAAARKAGIAQSRGETVCLVDSDDVLDSHYLEELWHVYRQTGAKVIIAPMVRFSQEKNKTLADFFEAGCLYGAQRVRVFDDFSAAMALCGKLIHRSCVTGLHFPEARTGDDILPSVALLAASDPIALAPKALYFYRCRPGSQSQAGAGRFEGLLKGFLQARRLLKEQGLYDDFAPGFEYICRVCLISFMEKYGLSVSEQKLLCTYREEFKVPMRVFRGRDFRFRVRQWMFEKSLKGYFSYSRLMHGLHRLLHRS